MQLRKRARGIPNSKPSTLGSCQRKWVLAASALCHVGQGCSQFLSGRGGCGSRNQEIEGGKQECPYLFSAGFLEGQQDPGQHLLGFTDGPSFDGLMNIFFNFLKGSLWPRPGRLTLSTTDIWNSVIFHFVCMGELS